MFTKCLQLSLKKTATVFDRWKYKQLEFTWFESKRVVAHCLLLAGSKTLLHTMAHNHRLASVWSHTQTSTLVSIRASSHPLYHTQAKHPDNNLRNTPYCSQVMCVINLKCNYCVWVFLQTKMFKTVYLWGLGKCGFRLAFNALDIKV